MSENIPDAEVTQLETALAALAPRPATLDRDRLMFLAGQRAAARRGWVLPCAAAAVAAATTLVAVLLLYQPPTNIVYREIPQSPPPAPSAFAEYSEAGPPPTGEYILLRNRVLTAGVDALPALPPDPSSGPTPNAIFRPHQLPRDDLVIPGGPL
jgi:hypothetical protein